MPAPDTVLFKDRLLYLLQPPIEQMFVGKQVSVPFPPYPYQLEGIAFLMPRHSALLADEMGLGKTIQTILALHVDPLTDLIGDASEDARPSIVVRPAGESASVLAGAFAAAATLRSAGYVVETLSSGDASAAYSLACSDQSPKLTLEGAGATTSTDDIESVLRVLGQAS